MSDETEKVDAVLDRMDSALGRLKDVAQGRIYNVGTKVTFRDKFGVVTDLNQGSEDPTGSTVDLKLEDGTTVESVPVTSNSLALLRQ